MLSRLLLGAVVVPTKSTQLKISRNVMKNALALSLPRFAAVPCFDLLCFVEEKDWLLNQVTKSSMGSTKLISNI